MLYQSDNRFVGFVVPSGGGSSESGECSSRGQPAPEQPWMATSPCPRKQRLTCWGAVDRVAGQVSRLLSPCSPTPGFQDHRLEVNSLHHCIGKSVASGYSCGGLKVACAEPRPCQCCSLFQQPAHRRQPADQLSSFKFSCRQDWRRIMLQWISLHQVAAG